MTEHHLTWTDNGHKGTLILDGHDLSSHVMREGFALSTQDGHIRADVRLRTRDLGATVTAGRVALHLTPAQEALLKAAGWARKGDVSVNADVLAGVADVLRAVAEGIEPGQARLARSLRSQAERLDAYVDPTNLVRDTEEPETL